MIDKLKYIETESEKYPVVCTINVLEAIQNEYESIEKWQEELSGNKNIKHIIWTFCEFINEGIDILNDRKEEKMMPISHKKTGRIITEIGLAKALDIIRDIVSDSFGNAEIEADEEIKN
jgi:hypothetical protein